jgi:hypothetical protein
MEGENYSGLPATGRGLASLVSNHVFRVLVALTSIPIISVSGPWLLFAVTQAIMDEAFGQTSVRCMLGPRPSEFHSYCVMILLIITFQVGAGSVMIQVPV